MKPLLQTVRKASNGLSEGKKRVLRHPLFHASKSENRMCYSKSKKWERRKQWTQQSFMRSTAR